MNTRASTYRASALAETHQRRKITSPVGPGLVHHVRRNHLAGYTEFEAVGIQIPGYAVVDTEIAGHRNREGAEHVPITRRQRVEMGRQHDSRQVQPGVISFEVIVRAVRYIQCLLGIHIEIAVADGLGAIVIRVPAVIQRDNCLTTVTNHIHVPNLIVEIDLLTSG